MFSNFFSENRAVYEIVSKNVVKPGRSQTAIKRRVACWISKATRAQAQTHSRAHTEIRKTYCFPTATMVSRTRLSVTLYLHCLSF